MFRKLMFGLVGVLIIISLVGALPSPTTYDGSHWKLIEDTEEDLYPLEFEHNKHKTTICIASYTATSNDDLPYIDFETSKSKPKIKATKISDGVYGYCYTIKDDDKRVKFGSNSIIYEWINQTWLIYDTDVYDKAGFYIEAWADGDRLGKDELVWIVVNGTEKFFFNQTENSTWSLPISELKLRVYNYDRGLVFDNGLIQQEFECTDWRFYHECEERRVLNINDLLESPENNITYASTIVSQSKDTIEGYLHCFQNGENLEDFWECRNEPYYFDVIVEGQINDTDPSLDLVFDSSDDLIFNNRTEGTALGARLDAPVLFMDFDKAPEGTYVQDNSIYNNFGTSSGSPTYNSSCGSSGVHDLGGCYEFDGVNDYIEVSKANSVDFANQDFSVGLWFKTDMENQGEFISRSSGASSPINYRIYKQTDDTLRFVQNDGSNSVATVSTNTYNDDEWHYVTGTFDDNGNMTLYVDGLQVDTTSASGVGDATSTGNLYIGVFNGASYPFNGSIDQVQIFDRALTADEILNLYNGTNNNSNYIGKYASDGDFKSLVFYNSTSTYWNITSSLADSDYQDTLDYVNTTGLVSYWNMDGGSVADVWGSNDGTNSGSTDTVGIVKHGRKFDGVNDYVNIASNITIPAQVTISLWVKDLESSVQNRWVTGCDDATDPTTCNGGDYSSLTLYHHQNNNVYFQWAPSDYNTRGVQGFMSYPDDYTWHHVVATFDSSDDSFAIYLDGVLKNTTLQTDNGNGEGTGTTPFAIGALQTRSGTPVSNQFFNGSIDEVMIYNRSLSADEITEMFNNQKEYYGIGYGDSSGIGLNSSSLVSYWSLDGHYDDIVGGNHGTPTGTNNATGISSGAMRFDGVDDYVEMSSAITVPSNFTFSSWIKTDASSTYRTIISSNITGTGYLFWRINNDNTMSLTMRDDTDGNQRLYSTVTASQLNDGKWHYVVVGRNSPTTQFYYIDGVAYTPTYTYQNAVTTDPIKYIGKLHLDGSGSSFFNGSIDEVLIYNKSLTASEVQELYKAGLTQHANANVTLQTRTATSYNISDANLLELFSFNNDNSTHALGETGKYNGTLTGTTVSDENGTVGKGRFYSGTGEYINLGTAMLSTSDSYQPYTFSWWSKTNLEGASNWVVVGQYIGGANDRFGVGITAAGALLYWKYGSTLAQSDPVSLDTWHHYTAVKNSDRTLDIYIDGVEVPNINGAGTDTQDFSNTNTYIGAMDSSTWLYGGVLDEVRIYDRAFTADEVANLYNLGSYHIEWGDWNDNGQLVDATNTVMNESANFIQSRFNYNTDDTDVSSYILNYSIEYSDGVSAEDNPPTFDTPPSNISILLNATGIEESFTVSDDNGVDDCWLNDTSLIDVNLTHYYNITTLAEQTKTTYNLSCNDTIGQITSIEFWVEVNETVIAPIVTVLFPTNTTYTSVQTQLNYSASPSGGDLDKCWYSIDEGITNESISDANSTNFTTASSEGLNTWNVYCNNTVGEVGMDSVVFTQDITTPVVNIIYPTATTYTSNVVQLNYSVSASADKCWYNIGGSNISMTCGNNITGLNPGEGSHTWYVYSNNSVGEEGSDSVSFTVDYAPTLTVDVPANGATYNSTTINLTGSCSDTQGVDDIWYSLDGGTNTTFTFNTTFATVGYEVYHTLEVWCNDTINQVDYDTTTFYVGVTSETLGTTITSACQKTKYIKDGYFPYGRLGCSIEFI